MTHDVENLKNMNYYLMIIGIILYSLSGNTSATECVNNIEYDGKGAGQVVFNVTAHTSKGISCSDCHEGHGLSFALFDMKKGTNTITMRKMQMGSSCGHCHDGKKAFSATDNLRCANCHHK